MKHIKQLSLAIALACHASLTIASGPDGSPQRKTKQETQPASPSENNDATKPYCKVPGTLIRYPNNIFSCLQNSNKACVFIPCSDTRKFDDPGTTTSVQPADLPAGVEIPEGQNFIGYYDENHVFQVRFTSSPIEVSHDAATQNLIITVTP